MSENKTKKEDKALIKACLKGKSLAQEKLFKKYYGLMMGICLRYAVDKHEANDILQEGYIKIFKNISKFKFEGSFISWIKRIMINTAIDKYRKNATIPNSFEVNEEIDSKNINDVLSNLEKQDLLKCINSLSIGYRTVFNLYVIEGFSHKEIAEKLQINEGTSKSQLFKAKQKLKIIINKDFS
ncbi:MAG: sigma-70 family RNA polymerase sigma factor [Bacteroidota bacterium]|nr:sigma-70 family RNA polymerase sigma factor [Bacteroidota bacterium]